MLKLNVERLKDIKVGGLGFCKSLKLGNSLFILQERKEDGSYLLYRVRNFRKDKDVDGNLVYTVTEYACYLSITEQGAKLTTNNGETVRNVKLGGRFVRRVD